LTINRLSGGGSANFTSKISAKQWARMAREKGLPIHAAAWERAYDEGWDDMHYRPDPVPEPIRRISPTGGR
jgi:hypothetical protein